MWTHQARFLDVWGFVRVPTREGFLQGSQGSFKAYCKGFYTHSVEGYHIWVNLTLRQVSWGCRVWGVLQGFSAGSIRLNARVLYGFYNKGYDKDSRRVWVLV